MNDECLFCKIIDRQIEADVLYEDDLVLVIRDIGPQAPVHLLVLPKRHIATVNDVRAEHGKTMSRLLLTASKIARDQGVGESGYRLVINCGEGAGQSVFHLHMHLLGGRQMQWPPG